MDRHLHGEEPPPRKNVYQQPWSPPPSPWTKLDALLRLARRDARRRGLTLEEYLSLPRERRRY